VLGAQSILRSVSVKVVDCINLAQNGVHLKGSCRHDREYLGYITVGQSGLVCSYHNDVVVFL
jgi:hypothetical protein